MFFSMLIVASMSEGELSSVLIPSSLVSSFFFTCFYYFNQLISDKFTLVIKF